MMTIGFLGYGEIGKAISKVYEQFPNDYEIFVRDLNKDEFEAVSTLDVLNVCIPFVSDLQFLTAVRAAIKNTAPTLVIIHATVPVGTTDKIENAVHSPVRGVHPNLFAGVCTFEKFVGSINPTIAIQAATHLQQLGLKVTILKNAKATELLKLLDTTYYGVCIEYHRFAKELCDKEDVPFNEVMTLANITYNEGYTKLDKSNVVRPVLYPPEGQLGGHCVEPNSLLLEKQYGTNILQHMRERN